MVADGYLYGNLMEYGILIYVRNVTAPISNSYVTLLFQPR
jgi:hypothetical protein